jgi:hypothetical protein
MGFLVPAFLAGLAALAVPLLLHLRQRDRDTPVPFPSLMFLEQLTIRTEQRQRVSDWPLLLLRLLLLSLLVFAFARPLFRSRAVAGSDVRSRAVVVLLDRSLSMDYAGTWPRALDSARAVIDGLRGNDRVAVVTYDDEAETRQRLTDDRGAARAALAGLTPRARGTRLAPALRVARQLLLDAPFAAAEIVVVSDLQRGGATGVAGVELPAGVKVRGIPVGPTRWSNAAVHAVEARRVADGARMLLAVKARLRHFGDSASPGRTVHLVLNGREATTKAARLATAGETVVTFEPVPAPEGSVAVQVAMDADALALDDTLVAVVPRDDDLLVLMRGGGDRAQFFERALEIGRAPTIRPERAGNPARMPAAGVRVFWDELPDASNQAWIENGGGAVVVLGRRLADRKGAVSPLLPVVLAGTADRLADRGGTLREVRTEHPLFQPFREIPDALGAVRLFRYARVDAVPGSDILARFDDGLPAVIEQRVGNGRVIALALPLDNDAGDFPLQPVFLPFVRQLMLHASGRDATPLWRTTGERWSLPGTVAEPVVQAPDGSLMRPTADSLGAAVPLPDAGVYRAFSRQAGGEAAALLAVNVPGSESVLTPMDTSELLLGVRTGADSVRLGGTAKDTDEDLERKQAPWRALLMLALAALLIETFMATRGRRGTARRVSPASNAERTS